MPDLKKLGPKNIGDVIGLFHLVNELAPHGHLADRTREELAYVLTNQNSMSVGAYHGENLVAYSISRLASNPYRDSQLMAFVEQSGSPFYVGMGTVVHPQHRGQRLGFRLTKLRWRFLRRRGPCHLTGLVALNNRSSIASLLHAGAILVGLARDATAQNYIVYQGLLQQRLYLREHRVYIDLGDKYQPRNYSLANT